MAQVDLEPEVHSLRLQMYCACVLSPILALCYTYVLFRVCLYTKLRLLQLIIVSFILAQVCYLFVNITAYKKWYRL